jgi:Uma2 family endonuclease
MAAMSIPQPRPPTLQELLDWERQQPERYEYVGGVLRAMVGATLLHGTIAGNVYSSLRTQMRDGKCRPFMEHGKVVTGDSFMYPDVAVTCGTYDKNSDIISEPTVIFEILSKSTQDYDRGSKWLAYQLLPTLQDFVLIEQRRIFVEIYSRSGNSWKYTVLQDLGDVAPLPSIDAKLPLADIYEDSGVDP